MEFFGKIKVREDLNRTGEGINGTWRLYGFEIRDISHPYEAMVLTVLGDERWIKLTNDGLKDDAVGTITLYPRINKAKNGAEYNSFVVHHFVTESAPNATEVTTATEAAKTQQNAKETPSAPEILPF